MEDMAVDFMGDCLDTPSSKSEEFKMTYLNPAQRKEAYLDYYVHNHPAPSWIKVTGALNGNGLFQQAVDVINTYVQGISPIITLKLMW